MGSSRGRRAGRWAAGAQYTAAGPVTLTYREEGVEVVFEDAYPPYSSNELGEVIAGSTAREPGDWHRGRARG